MKMSVISLLLCLVVATGAQETPKISFISGPEVVTDLGKIESESDCLFNP